MVYNKAFVSAGESVRSYTTEEDLTGFFFCPIGSERVSGVFGGSNTASKHLFLVSFSMA